MQRNILPEFHVDFLHIQILQTSIYQLNEFLNHITTIRLQRNYLNQNLVAVVFDSADANRVLLDSKGFELVWVKLRAEKRVEVVQTVNVV